MLVFPRIVALAVLVSACLTGCRAEPPPQAVDGAFGVVRAHTDDRAQSGSELLAELVPRLRALLPGTQRRAVEVWLQDELELYRGSPFPEHVAGMAEYARGRIYLRDSDLELKLHLAHELVHLLVGEEWKSLPAVLEEGLCDRAAYDVVADPPSTLRAWRLLEAGGAFGGIDARLEMRLPREAGRRGRTEVHEIRLGADSEPLTSLAGVLALSDGAVFEQSTWAEGSGLYGVGYFVVSRIVDRVGYDGLHELCERATAEGRAIVPVEWILAAAELSDEPESVRRAIESEFSSHDLPDVAPLCAGVLADAIVKRGKESYPHHNAENFIRAARPSLALSSSRARWGLRNSQSFYAAVLERW